MKSGALFSKHDLTCGTYGSKSLSVDTSIPFPYTHLRLRPHFPGFTAPKNQTRVTTPYTDGLRTPAL